MKLTPRARLADLEARVKGLESLAARDIPREIGAVQRRANELAARLAFIHDECRRHQDRTDTMFVKILDDPSDGARVLALPIPGNDAGTETVGGYLRELLHSAWEQREDFDGGRPFGNSGWEFELYAPLIIAGMVEGSVDAQRCVISVDETAANKLIHAAIDAMAGPR